MEEDLIRSSTPSRTSNIIDLINKELDLCCRNKNIENIYFLSPFTFNSLCEWFIDNKLSIHFGEEKTKSIPFGTKGHLNNQTDLNIKYGDIKIKQYSKVTYMGCILDSNLSGESMVTKVLGLINGRRPDQVFYSIKNKQYHRFDKQRARFMLQKQKY